MGLLLGVSALVFLSFAVGYRLALAEAMMSSRIYTNF